MAFQYRVVTRGGGSNQREIVPPPPWKMSEFVFDSESDALLYASQFNRACKSPRINPHHIKATYQVRRENV